MGRACGTPRDGLEIGTGFRSGNPNGVTDVFGDPGVHGRSVPVLQ
jgi:hypothetical protein